MNAVDSALTSIHRHLASLNQAAYRISRTAPRGNLLKDTLQMMMDKRSVEVNLNTIRTAHDMTGTLIDLLT